MAPSKQAPRPLARGWKNFVLCGLLPSLCLVALVRLSPVAAADPPDPDLVLRFSELRDLVSNAPDDRLDSARKRFVGEALSASQRFYSERQPCRAMQLLRRVLGRAQVSRRDDPELFDVLYSRARSLRNDIRRSLDTGDRCLIRGSDVPPEVHVNHSDNTRFSATVTFGIADTTNRREADGFYTEVTIPGLEQISGVPGAPGVPTWQGLVALPRDSSATLRLTSAPRRREKMRLNLFPVQRDSVDSGGAVPALFRDAPFEKDAAAYAADAAFPASPCSIQALGRFRDVDIAQVSCAAGEYNPVRGELTLYRSLSFEIAFDGGRGTFLTSQGLSRFEPLASRFSDSVLNREALHVYVEAVDLSSKICAGEELLILATPYYAIAAEVYARWKNQKGIATTLIELRPDELFEDDGSPFKRQFANAIDALIEDRFANCKVRPSYVLLFGDVDSLPVARRDYSTDEDESTASDLAYGVVNSATDETRDISIDIVVGRISVDDLTEANAIVNKLIAYESSPPTQPSFYSNATVAGQFQCCRMDYQGNPIGYVPGLFGGLPGLDQRRFIQGTEQIRDELMRHAYTVERIYSQSVDEGDLSDLFHLQLPYNGDPTPRRYPDGGVLPLDLQPGYPWAGDTPNVIDAFNAGRFLILHRDHGYDEGWGLPSFQTGDLSSLANGPLTPVIYSVNCSSGAFTDTTDAYPDGDDSFLENLLRVESGGMIGGLGASTVSPTRGNTILARGFIDATWPDLAPEFLGEATRRLGDILLHSKVYLATQFVIGGNVTASEVHDEFIIWHLFGDPTLEMWTENPHGNMLGTSATIEADAAGISIQYDAPDGTEVTALQVRRLTTTSGRTELQSVPIGRATVRFGAVRIPFADPPDPDLPISYSAHRPNAVSVQISDSRSVP